MKNNQILGYTIQILQFFSTFLYGVKDLTPCCTVVGTPKCAPELVVVCVSLCLVQDHIRARENSLWSWKQGTCISILYWPISRWLFTWWDYAIIIVSTQTNSQYPVSLIKPWSYYTMGNVKTAAQTFFHVCLPGKELLPHVMSVCCKYIIIIMNLQSQSESSCSIIDSAMLYYFTSIPIDCISI